MAGMTYGERFQELREALGLDQEAMGRRLYGKPKRQGTISGIESIAGRVPRPSTVRQHARALGCPVSALLGPVDDTWVDRARRGAYDSTAKRTKEARRHRQEDPAVSIR